MMDPLWLKYAHVLGAILIFGTGLGTAFHLWCAHLSKAAGGCCRRPQHGLGGLAVHRPAVALQPVRGALLAWSYGWSLLEPWIVISLVFTCWQRVCAGCRWCGSRCSCGGWRRRPRATARLYPPLSSLGPDLVCLGWPAFIAMFVITWLMIFKPRF